MHLYTLGDAKAALELVRDEALLEYEDACFRAALESATTTEERAFWSRWIAERARTRPQDPPGA